MSLINQVLLDLDRRHAQPQSVPLLARGVTQAPRKSRLAVRIVAAFVAIGAGAGAAVVASTSLPATPDRPSTVAQGVVTPQPVSSGTVPAGPRDSKLTARSHDPFATDDSNAIGGNPLGGSAIRVASNSNDDVQLLAISPAQPGPVSTSERAAPLSSDPGEALPPARMPRMWDATPAKAQGRTPRAPAPAKASTPTLSADDDGNVAMPDARVAALSPAARRSSPSTTQAVIDAQDPDATIRKARSLVKPSVVRTEVKPVAGESTDAALAQGTAVALAPAVVPPAPNRRRGVHPTAVAPALPDPSVEKRATPLSAGERADAEYQKALALHLQGQAAEARVIFASALREDRRHAGARQALAVGLVGDGKLDEAQALLAEGLELNPRELQLSATLARVQAQRQDSNAAITTLKAALAAGPATAQKTEVADARALLATLQQRSGSHADAIENYSLALRQVPGNGTWWIGLGISLAATGRAESARDAFQRARATDSLSPDLDRYVEQRLLATATR